MIFTVFSNKNGLPAGGWWLVTKRRYMRCSGLADVENDIFDSVLEEIPPPKRMLKMLAFVPPPTGISLSHFGKARVDII